MVSDSAKTQKDSSRLSLPVPRRYPRSSASSSPIPVHKEIEVLHNLTRSPERKRKQAGVTDSHSNEDKENAEEYQSFEICPKGTPLALPAPKLLALPAPPTNNNLTKNDNVEDKIPVRQICYSPVEEPRNSVDSSRLHSINKEAALVGPYKTPSRKAEYHEVPIVPENSIPFSQHGGEVLSTEKLLVSEAVDGDPGEENEIQRSGHEIPEVQFDQETLADPRLAQSNEYEVDREKYRSFRLCQEPQLDNSVIHYKSQVGTKDKGRCNDIGIQQISSFSTEVRSQILNYLPFLHILILLYSVAVKSGT